MLLIDQAVKYVAERLPVLPLCWPDNRGECACGRNHQGRAVGKVPLLEHGLTDAALTVTKAKDYWTQSPKANIGIAIPPGLFVLDVDIDHGGFDSLARMQKENDCELTPTWLITTGGGGQHYWYKTDKAIRNTTKLAGYEGLDIRGVGGYVVAPPSMHRSGYRYEVSPVWDGAITMAPAKLISLATTRISPITTESHSYEQPITEGSRNDTLTRDAGAMRRRGLSEDAIYAALQVTNQERCQPPLPDGEVRIISKSVSRYEPEANKPRFKISL